MSVKVTAEGRVAKLAVQGRIDLESSATIKSEVRRCLSRGQLHLLMDMSGVEFINSSGLGTLVSALKEVRLAQGHMVFCNLARYVREIFEITQLANIFELYPNEEEARAALTASRARV